MRVSRKTPIHRLTQTRRRHVRRDALPGLALRTTLVSLFLGLSPISRADDFWKRKPPAQWSVAEALKVVRRSPWARLDVVVFLRQEPQAAYSIPTRTKHCDPDAIDQNGNCLQKGRIEAPIDSSHRYVITVKLEQPGRAGFEPFAVTPAGKPVLHATLKTRRGTVAPLEVEFTGAGASSSAHFFFPRTLDGAPLLGSGRDSAEFKLHGVGFAVRSKFTLDPEFLN